MVQYMNFADQVANSKQFLSFVLARPCNITRPWLNFNLATREVTLHHGTLSAVTS